jgi:hypothetical protein
VWEGGEKETKLDLYDVARHWCDCDCPDVMEWADCLKGNLQLPKAFLVIPIDCRWRDHVQLRAQSVNIQIKLVESSIT